MSDQNTESTTQFAAHDPEKIDVWIVCLRCNGGFNGFLAKDDMMFYPNEENGDGDETRKTMGEEK
ncbi:MAG: hypothetical protein WC405_18525 [Syntrophales bacterium]